MSQAAGDRRLPEAERNALTRVLDALIPPREDGRLPGAGELGVTRHLEEVMAREPELRAAVRSGLAALDAWARRAGAADFLDLAPAARVEALEAVAAEQPGFLPGLIFHTYVGYYRHDRVVQALGLEARPPFPRGYPLEPGDLGRLEAVRRRPRLWRDA
jgi:hypothetical protein